MKKKDDIDTLFKNLEGRFDVHESPTGHQSRFLERIQTAEKVSEKKNNWWRPLSIAASFLVLIALGMSFFNTNETKNDLASVSPEMEKTQSFFTAAIKKELQTLKSHDSAETQALVKDAIQQLTILEQEYETLKQDLTESGNDKRVIYAMITNFQNRIDLLQNVIETIEEVKTLNTNKDEIIL